jgi:AcrR family transcriptional regulator
MTTAARTRKAREDAAAAHGEPPQEVKERIRTAALTLFGQKGYSAVTVRQICKLAGTTAPMVYYYYGNKRGLYRSILDESLQWRRKELENARKSQGDPLTRLRRILDAWLGLGQEPVVRELRLFFLRELFGLGSDMYKESVESSDRRFRHALKTVIQEGIDQGIFRPVKVEMAVLAITGIVNTFSRRAALGAPIRLEEGVEQVMDTFVYGLVDRTDGGDGARPAIRPAP